MRLNNKNKILILGLLLTIVLVYQFAIKNTFEYYSLYNELKSKSNSIEKFNQQEFQLINKEKNLSNLLEKYNIGNNDNFNTQNYLLQHLNKQVNNLNLKIVSFDEPKTIEKDNKSITHFTFSISGNFNNTLKLINSIDNNPLIGNIIHTNTTKKMNFKANKEDIITTIFIEKINKN